MLEVKYIVLFSYFILKACGILTWKCRIFKLSQNLYLSYFGRELIYLDCKIRILSFMLGRLHIKKRSGIPTLLSNWTKSLEETLNLISKLITHLQWHYQTRWGSHKLQPYDIRGRILPRTVSLWVEKHIENISLWVRELVAFAANGAPSVSQRVYLADNRWQHSVCLLQTVGFNI